MRKPRSIECGRVKVYITAQSKAKKKTRVRALAGSFLPTARPSVSHLAASSKSA